MSEAPSALKLVSLRRRLLPALLSASVVLPLGLALNYAMNVVLARILPVEGYGLFVYAYSMASLLSLLAALGFSSSVMRFIAEYRAQGNSAALRGLVTGSLSLLCIASTLIAFVLLLAGWMWPDQKTGLGWAVLLLLPLTIDSWREGCMRGLNRTMAAMFPRQVILPLLTLIAVLATGMNSVTSILVTFTGLLVLLEAFGLLYLRRAFIPLVGGVQSTWSLAHWLRVSLPIAGAVVARQGIMRWDIVVLGLFVSMGTVGPYAAAARTALLASLVLRVINLVVAPLLAELYHSGDHARFRQLLIAATISAAVLGLPLYLFVMLYPQAALALFGQGYEGAALSLQILATGQFVNIATGPVGLALSMTRHEMSYLRVSVVSAATSLALLFLLVPYWGAVGAATATAVGTILVNVGAAMVAWVHFGVNRRAPKTI